ncbi:GtrA family protein [Tsuneonella sp. CC-YZS046]|uniref:GtrA family protein n=1 Tax=Tsuneonella sp. CC-YZS046 TaxID=3042152 RepID=UPI002D79D783|nr:GtrA family protein [Tsuneonella sp. CC-YZS046]WRO65592.1 GtrA family protein [Tsuneonella sp. CC-YZS046]
MPGATLSFRLWEIVRYYQAGAVNAAFGYGLYALLLWAGLGMYMAQLIAHILGVAFNYFTYSSHVFRGADPAKTRFAASYVVNYLISLCFLALVSLILKSPYAAGLAAIILTSAVNYLILKRLVFAPRKRG